MEEYQVGPFKTWNVEGKAYVIKANPNKGFNFDYSLYIPNNVNCNTTLIVEPSNHGGTYDWSNEKILEEMKKEAIYPEIMGNPIYEIATNLSMPILYPIFPKWHNGNGPIYNIMLSSNSLNYKTPMLNELGLKRVDLQLIQMIKDAKTVLENFGIEIDEKIIMDGFSASSKFANRFTLLHPEIVKLCIGGGISGALTLPIEKINNETLLWPVGIGNLQELLGESTSLNIEEFKKVPQFYYMGMIDTNDPYEVLIDSDGNIKPKFPELIEDDEVRQMYKYLGEKMLDDRWKNSMKYYNDLGINATFKSYEGIGHNPKAAKDDIQEKIKNIDKQETKRSKI